MQVLRRWGAVVAVLAATLLGTPVTAAGAADPVVDLEVPGTGYLTQRGIGPTGGYRVWLDPRPGAGRSSQADVTLTVDATDLAGVARLRTRRECGDHTWTTEVFTCALGTLTSGGRNYPDALYIEAAPGAAKGSHGTLRYTFSAPGGADATFETDVQVAGPDLRERVEKPRTTVTAGRSFDFTPRLRNAGRSPARGFVVQFESAFVHFRTEYSNCRYAPERWAVCRFDETLEPGQAYAFDGPVGVGVPDSMLNGSFTYSARLIDPSGVPLTGMGAAPGDDEGMTRGTGPKLSVRPVDGGARGYGDAYEPGTVKLRTSQTADLRATTSTLTGRTGQTVDLKVAVHNAGPGRVAGAYLAVTPPEGTTIVEPTPPPDPDGELEWQWECSGRKNTTHYCDPDRALEPGDTWETTLQVRIVERVRAAEGRLEVREDPKRPANDPKRGDNVVPIRIDATGGPLVEPTTHPTPLPTAAGAAADTRGGGPGGGTIAAAALLALVVLSGFLLWWVKSRRARASGNSLKLSD
ncbi:hypothetical protein V2W30_21985 [Streptomyces sp. Q6]|uniref:Uncharacterized protein n=1 Tax=Streptomyces citrinus TaxID=3118173 RepID=A0ACD5AF78_9ACTN